MAANGDDAKWDNLLQTFLAESTQALQSIDVDGGLPRINRRAVKDTLAAVSQEANKVGVLLNSKAEFEHARDITKECEQSLAQFVSACRHIAFGSGKTLHKHVRDHAETVVAATQALMRAALGGSGAGPTQDLKPLVGIVWQRGETAGRMATDDLTVIGRGVTERCAIVVDALREMKEALAVAQEAASRPPEPEAAADSEAAVSAGGVAGGADDAADSDDDDNDDFDFDDEDDEPLSPREILVIPACVNFFEQIIAFYKGIVRCLITLKQASAGQPPPSSEPLEKVLVAAAEIANAVDGVNDSAIYTPQDLVEMRVNAATVAALATGCCEHFEALEAPHREELAVAAAKLTTLAALEPLFESEQH